MGYHTWFHIKSDRSLEEAKKLALKEIELLKVFCGKNGYLAQPWNFAEDIELVMSHDMETIIDLQPESIIEYHNGSFYIEVGEANDDYSEHDAFRVNGELRYSENILFGFDETLKFIEDNKGDIELCEDSIPRVKKFFERYPDGMINFG